MVLHTKVKVVGIVLTFLFFLPLSLFSSNVDFSIFIKNDDGSLRFLTDREVIPLNNEIQIKIYSKSQGELDIFYSSSGSERSSILNEPIPVSPGQLITLPSEDEYLPMELSEGKVSFEFAFKSNNEKTLRGFNFFATEPENKEIKNQSNETGSKKTDIFHIQYLDSSKNMTVMSNLLESVTSSVKTNTQNIKINKLRGFEDIYDTTAKGTVLIESYDEKENIIGFGSGAIISKNQIVTNVHVIQNATYVVVVPYGGLTENPIYYLASIDKILPKKDLALLKIEERFSNYLEIDKSCDVKVASDAHAVGHPEGNYWSYTKGYISQIRKNFEWSYSENLSFKAEVIQTQTPINPGNSGGPLVNSNSKLIGINSFGDSKSQGINFALSCNEIINLIEAGNNFDGWEKTGNNNQDSETNDELTCYDQDSDGYEESCYFDFNNNGSFDGMLYHENQDGVPDIVYYDLDENDYAETVVVLANETSEVDYDVYYFDNDQDGNWDEVGYDYNLDQEIDKITKYS